VVAVLHKMIILVESQQFIQIFQSVDSIKTVNIPTQTKPKNMIDSFIATHIY
jgi:hypothetical protein